MMAQIPYSISKAMFAKYMDGKLVDYPVPDLILGISPPLNEEIIVGIDPAITGSFSVMLKDLDTGLMRMLSPNVINPLFQLEFVTRRVRLRRTVLAYMGKPEHIKKLKSIVRLPRVIIEKRP